MGRIQLEWKRVADDDNTWVEDVEYEETINE